jgi:hypothetical protein
MTKPNCLNCLHLRHKQGSVWCRKGSLKPKKESLPLKKGERYNRVGKTCKEFEGMDE